LRLKKYAHRHCSECHGEIPYVDDLVRVTTEYAVIENPIMGKRVKVKEVDYECKDCHFDEPVGFRERP
jgi:hypothetical protein